MSDNDNTPSEADFAEIVEQIRAQFAVALSDPRYLQMLLGLALLQRMEASMTVAAADYAQLIGQGLAVEPLPDGSYILRLRAVTAADGAMPGMLAGMAPVGRA